MKRRAIIIALLYGIILLMLVTPACVIAFIGSDSPLKLEDLAKTLYFWIWISMMVIGQMAMLAMPVNIVNKRPPGKTPLVFSIVAGGLMMGLLLAGAIISIGEVILQDTPYLDMYQMALSGLVLMWGLWALIFYRWSRGIKPQDFIEKQCRALYRGSMLELLVVVPMHVFVRQREYCCAGYSTFFGIAFGISVMIFSFGPGIFFLYAELIERNKERRLRRPE